MNEFENLVSISDAAVRAGVSRNTMHLAASRGLIKAVRIGTKWFVNVHDVDRWKRENYRPQMSRRGTNKK
jgi:excisionase family DNA binding protein